VHAGRALNQAQPPYSTRANAAAASSTGAVTITPAALEAVGAGTVALVLVVFDSSVGAGERSSTRQEGRTSASVNVQEARSAMAEALTPAAARLC